MIVKAILALGVLLNVNTGEPPVLLEGHPTLEKCLERATTLNDDKDIVDADAKKAGVAFFCLEIKLPGTPT